jgi:hypothetical protein
MYILHLINLNELNMERNWSPIKKKYKAISFFSTMMAKPKEFAHLIKNKFGSADNINQMSK